MAAQDSKENEKIKVAVLGSGAYGTAMAMIAARKGHDVVIWSIFPEQVKVINDKEKGGWNPDRFTSEVKVNDDGTKEIPVAYNFFVFFCSCLLSVKPNKVASLLVLFLEFSVSFSKRLHENWSNILFVGLLAVFYRAYFLLGLFVCFYHLRFACACVCDTLLLFLKFFTFYILAQDYFVVAFVFIYLFVCLFPIQNPQDFLRLPKNVTATTSLEDTIKDAKLILHCIPTQPTKKVLAGIGSKIPKDVLYVCTAKGIDQTTGQLLCDILPEGLQRESMHEVENAQSSDSKTNESDAEKTNNIAYLSGPSFAIEIMKDEPMAVVVASYNIKTATQVQKYLNSPRFRIYITTDVIGVEMGGALKNPLAIGSGIAIGLGYGASSVAAIVTRGAVEMQRLAIAMGGRPETLAGLSGMGDLMLTCFSSQSRNNRCGQAIGKGKTAQEACDEIGEVVEGVSTARMVEKLRKEMSEKNRKRNSYAIISSICGNVRW